MKTLLARKIGSFELAVGFAAVELAFGSALRALVLGGVAAGFHLAERHFKGPFSLSDLHALLKGKPKNEPT